jgi:Xaa-Pro aminopeptidase
VNPGADTADLAPMAVGGRVGQLRRRLPEAGCDCLLVTSLSNVRYLSGFTGSAGMLLVGPDDTLLVTDGRYRTQAGEQLATAGVPARIEIGGLADQHRALAEAVDDGRRVGLEAAAVTWAAHRVLAELFEGSEVVPTTGVVEALRRVKDEGEQARVQAAAGIADRALEQILDLLVAGRPEAEVALELDSTMRRLGAQGSAFETIVAAGPNGAKPHARPGPRPVGRGELVVIDFGATVDGYRSDMTRTFCVGPPADPTLQRMYEVVQASQAAGVQAVRAGVAASDVDGACRDVIEEAGWGDRFVHATGHGVGIDIHEAPAVSATSADTLEESSVVTVEPGVYLPDHGGVRIEDTLIVTEQGCRAVTRFPKQLVLG